LSSERQTQPAAPSKSSSSFASPAAPLVKDGLSCIRKLKHPVVITNNTTTSLKTKASSFTFQTETPADSRRRRRRRLSLLATPPLLVSIEEKILKPGTTINKTKQKKKKNKNKTKTKQKQKTTK